MIYGQQVGQKKIVYIDSIDFECEIEFIRGMTYPFVDDVDLKSCTRIKCGVYKVLVEAIEYIPPAQIGKISE